MLEHLAPESQSGNLKTGTRSYEEITSISFVGGGGSWILSSKERSGGWILSSKENVTCFAEVTQTG